MKNCNLKIVLSAGLVFLVLFVCSTSCFSSNAQDRRERRPVATDTRGNPENPGKKFQQLLQEMKSKGYDVSEAEALNDKARQAMNQGDRFKARQLLAQATTVLEKLKAGGLTPTEESYTPKSKSTIFVSVSSEKVRVINSFPKDVSKATKAVLENFKISELQAEDGKITVNTDFPVLIEEYPYSDLTLKNNKAFGATESGLVRLPNKRTSIKSLNQEIDKILEMMSLAGLGLSRDFQSYDTMRIAVEKEKGTYDFSLADHAVSSVMKNGFEYIGRLGLHYEFKKEGLPQDEAAYLNYVKATVTRYAGRIKYWQTLKEPNPQKRNRMGNDAGMKPEDVVKILRLSYTTIKKIDPDATVYFPGLGAPIKGGSYTDETYFSRILSLGGGDYFDALGFDAYVFDVEEQLVKYRETLDKYGVSKPLWVAQVGVPSGKTNLPIDFKGGGSEKAQVEFMVQSYAKAFALGAEKVFWGEFIDKSKGQGGNRDEYTATWDMTGLFYSNTWKMKPGYFTHRLLATALNDFTEAQRVASNVVKFTFSDRSPIYIVWPQHDEISPHE